MQAIRFGKWVWRNRFK